jgi:hypothetical protein
VSAEFKLGNSSTVRKRISVLVHDSDFSDLSVCTFWLAPHAPLRTYRMRTMTTEPWVNATISFYAATAGSDGGAYLVDDVFVEYVPAASSGATECLDPTTPAPAGGPPSASLLTNGDFESPSLAPWTPFGTLTHQVAAGVFEFVRPTSTPPAGVVLQATGQSLTANEILTATFELGNSSAVRKRATVLLHDLSFSDLSACTFWLEPGQPLMPHMMRTFTTQPWANATLSVYAATVGPEPWTRLDNVTFQRTPAMAVTGTECIGPASTLLKTSPGRNSGGAGTSARSRRLTLQPQSGGVGRAGAAMGTDGEFELTVDLRDAVAARLSFLSWLEGGPFGEVQVTADGTRWLPIALAPVSTSWQPMSVDLDAWLGRVVHVRFAPSMAEGPPPAWRLAEMRVAIER